MESKWRKERRCFEERKEEIVRTSKENKGDKLRKIENKLGVFDLPLYIIACVTLLMIPFVIWLSMIDGLALLASYSLFIGICGVVFGIKKLFFQRKKDLDYILNKVEKKIN